MTGRKQVDSDFVPEWCALGALALLDADGRLHIHLSFLAHGARLPLSLALALSVTFAPRAFSVRRGGLMAEYFALSMAASTTICALSYLCLASGGPLVDCAAHGDGPMLGFDWLAGYRFVQAHSALAVFLGIAYGSLVYQGLYCGVLLGLMNDRKNSCAICSGCS